MLSTMRQNLKSLTWILWLAVASFVIAIFVDWGRAGDAARAGASANWMARVNGRSISVSEFQNTYLQLDRFYRQIYRDQYDPQALGVARQALGQLVRDRLVLEEARRLGLRVSDEEVNERIHNDPSFQEDGRFVGVERYRQQVRSIGFEPAVWEENIRGALLSQKYRRLITDGVTVSREEVLEDYRRRNEKVVAEYVMLAAEDHLPGEPAPESDLVAFHAAHSDDYLSPERRRGTYVLIDPDELPGQTAVTDEEARRYYDENVDRLYATPEQVRASHILFRVAVDATPEEEAAARAAAEEVLAKVQAGEDFAELAVRFSEDETNASRGGDLGFFDRARMVPEFSEVAFSLPVEGTSGLVRTQFGYHIIRVDERRDPSTRPFSEVRDAIVRQLEFTRSRELLRETVATFRDEVGGDPAAFDAAAARLGLEVRETGWLSSGASVPELGEYPQVAQALFRTEVGSVSRPVTLPEGTLFLRNNEIQPPQPLPFAEARAEVEEDWRHRRAMERTRELARDAAGGAPDLAEVASSLGVEVERTIKFSRLQPVPPFDAASRDLAFSLPLGQVSAPRDLEEGVLLFAVAEREEFDPAAFEERRGSLERSMLQQRRDRLFGTVVARLEGTGQVQFNEARLAAFEDRT